MGNPLHDIPERLIEFGENLVEECVFPTLRDEPESSSQGSDTASPKGVVLRKHSIYDHLPKERNFKICRRTKNAKALYRKRNGNALPRAVTSWKPGRWGPQGVSPTGGGGLGKVPNLRVCEHPFTLWVVAHAVGEGRINDLSLYRLVGVPMYLQ